MTILQCRTELEVRRCWCGLEHAVPKSLVDAQKEERHRGGQPISIFCPLGHKWVAFEKSEEQVLRDQLQRERQQNDQEKAYLRDERDRQSRKAAAARGQVTKFKRLITKGVCPCCRRPFANLQQHMAKQHPDFDPEKLANVEP